MIEIAKLKEREAINVSENTKLQATLNQLEKVFLGKKKVILILKFEILI